LVITQTAKGRTGWVLSGAVVIWVLAQLGLRNGIEGLLNNFMPANLGHFDIFAWQFLFVTGLVIGFHKRKGTLPGFLVKPPKSLTAIVAVMAALIFADRYGLFGFFGLTFVGYPTSITLLGPVRILDFALLGYLIVGLAGKYKEWFEIRWLAFLGQHSLYVFAYHVLLCYGLKLFQDRITAMSLAPKLIFFALVIASLTIPAWLHQRIRTWYRESRAAGKITPVPPSVNAT